jgi:hypothetical protein
MQGGKKPNFAEIDQCKPFLQGRSLAGNLGGSVALSYNLFQRKKCICKYC